MPVIKMRSLFRKEIVHFLGSLTGYLAVFAFLFVSGMFLWVLPGNYNIPENGYATLEPFFQLAPWLYLFLVPAITMRLFAEEKRSGTIELLLTRPIRDYELVLAKFLAGLALVILTLLPALIWFWSVFQLGNPPGNIDIGATWGAFIGLFLLAMIYVSIGLLTSAISDNMIVAFILSVLGSFLFYLGFEFIAGAGVPYFAEKLLTWFSINDHYVSVSRGALDSRDVIYYLGMTALLLYLTTLFIRNKHNSKLQIIKISGGLLLAILLLYGLSGNVWYRIDLTAEKRYSLSPLTKQIARTLDEPVTVELFLTGELPPGFRKLKQAVTDKVKDIGVYAGKPVRLVITDPYASGSLDKRNAFFRELEAAGVKPVDLRHKTDKGIETTRIFPGALITKGNNRCSVSFLKNNPGLNHEINLNNSLESIEFELVSAFRKLMVKEKPGLVFLQGHGELNQYEVLDIRRTLSETFTVDFTDATSLFSAGTVPKVIVIAAPAEPFSEPDKFVLDQLLMKGSRLIWLVDPVEVSLDSLSQGYMTLAYPRNLNLDDMLFHYGVRLNNDLVQDVVCASILVNTSGTADRPEFTPQPWYYSPLLTPSDNHPVSKDINPAYAEFVSSIDTVRGRGNIRSTVILHTSPYGRRIRTPAPVSLGSINQPPARELFNRPFIPTGVLLEGRFTSVFRNRLLNNITGSPSEFIGESPETRMILFSDGNLIANKVRYVAGKEPEILPLGYDRVSLQTFGNRELLVNAIQYLADEEGIMQLRSTSLNLRLLDKVKLKEQQQLRKWINVGLPLLILLVFAVLFNGIRKRKYKVINS